MKYALVFMPHTASYRVHASDCSAAIEDGLARHPRHRFPAEFNSVEEARAFADADETEKAGEPTKAAFKACPCTRAR